MVVSLRDFFFSVGYAYDNPIDARRARGLLVLNWITLFVGILSSIGFARNPGTDAAIVNPLTTVSQVTTYVVPLVSIASILLLKQGRLALASWAFVVVIAVGTGLVIAGGFYGGNSLMLIIPLTAAGSLLERRGLLTVALLLFVFILIGTTLQSRLPVERVVVPAERWQLDLQLALLSLGLGTFFLFTFSGLTHRIARESQSEAKTLNQISDFVGSITADSEEFVYIEAVNFIRNKLLYSFAQMFYLDNEGKLSRRLRVSMGVHAVSEQRSDIIIADGSAIDEAARTLKPVKVSLDDAQLRRSHFLPSTTEAIALPVIYQNTLLAVLDVQTESVQRFSTGDIATLRSLATSIATTAGRIRLIESLRQNIKQQEDVNIILQQRLEEMRTDSGAPALASWDNYMQQRGQDVFGFNLENTQGNFIAAHDLPAELRPVLESGALQVSTKEDVKIVNIPISLRGEILGAMSFSIPKDRILSERQIETAQIVATRLALALENKRLFEQTQAQALRERQANEATNLLISATNVEAVMNVAASSFNEALGAIATRIHLQPNVMSEPEQKELAR